MPNMPDWSGSQWVLGMERALANRRGTLWLDLQSAPAGSFLLVTPRLSSKELDTAYALPTASGPFGGGFVPNPLPSAFCLLSSAFLLSLSLSFSLSLFLYLSLSGLAGHAPVPKA